MAKHLQKFRTKFDFRSKELTHYFPGHMAKGLQQLNSKLQDVDCVIEVHDARIPFTGRNTKFDGFLRVRPHILALNKIDLADLRHKELVEERLRERHGITKVVYTNCKDQIHHTVKRVLIPIIRNEVESRPRYNREGVDNYSVAIIGVPNVGKSSLINAMRRIHLKKGKATPVGGVAGVTRSVMEKIKISDNPLIYMVDSPGILHSNITNLEAGMKLALCATMKDHLVGEDVIADYLLYWLNKHRLFRYVRYFNLPKATDDIYEFLAHVARQENLILKQRSTSGGYVLRPNFIRAAQLVLRAFREGALGKINLDQDDIDKLRKKREDEKLQRTLQENTSQPSFNQY